MKLFITNMVYTIYIKGAVNWDLAIGRIYIFMKIYSQTIYQNSPAKYSCYMIMLPNRTRGCPTVMEWRTEEKQCSYSSLDDQWNDWHLSGLHATCCHQLQLFHPWGFCNYFFFLLPTSQMTVVNFEGATPLLCRTFNDIWNAQKNVLRIYPSTVWAGVCSTDTMNDKRKGNFSKAYLIVIIRLGLIQFTESTVCITANQPRITATTRQTCVGRKRSTSPPSSHAKQTSSAASKKDALHTQSVLPRPKPAPYRLPLSTHLFNELCKFECCWQRQQTQLLSRSPQPVLSSSSHAKQTQHSSIKEAPFLVLIQNMVKYSTQPAYGWIIIVTYWKGNLHAQSILLDLNQL